MKLNEYVKLAKEELEKFKNDPEMIAYNLELDFGDWDGQFIAYSNTKRMEEDGFGSSIKWNIEKEIRDKKD